MSKHTPGPWTYEPPDSGDPDVGLSPAPATVYAPTPSGDDMIVIATVHSPGYQVSPDPLDQFDEGQRWYGDIHRNGLLLAAAPELLEALKTLLGWAHCIVTPDPYEELDRDLAAARAAVQKAEGRS